MLLDSDTVVVYDACIEGIGKRPDPTATGGDGTMMTSDYGHTYFIHDNGVTIAMTRDITFADHITPGWKLFHGSTTYPVLDVIDIPALPAWCQTSAASMAKFMLCDCDNEHLCTECQQEAERWHAHMDRTYLYS